MSLQLAPSLHERHQMLAPARVGMADVQSVEESGREDAGAKAGEIRTSATSVPTTKQDGQRP